MLTNLLEGAWQSKEFVDGVDRYKQHGGQGYEPAHHIWPPRENIVIVFQFAGGNNAGDYHKLQRKRSQEVQRQ